MNNQTNHLMKIANSLLQNAYASVANDTALSKRDKMAKASRHLAHEMHELYYDVVNEIPFEKDPEKTKDLYNTLSLIKEWYSEEDDELFEEFKAYARPTQQYNTGEKWL